MIRQLRTLILVEYYLFLSRCYLCQQDNLRIKQNKLTDKMEVLKKKAENLVENLRRKHG